MSLPEDRHNFDDPRRVPVPPYMRPQLIQVAQQMEKAQAPSAERLFVETLAQDSEPAPALTTDLLLMGQYKILERIGFGTFGNVYKARDEREKGGQLCAVKVIKSRHIGKESVNREVDVIQRIQTLDHTGDRSFVVKMYRATTHYRHLIIISQLLGPSVSSVLNDNKRRGFSLYEVQKIGYQLASALNFLHTHEIIHNDIKPDNIAFLHPHFDMDEKRGYKTMRDTAIRIVDFGSATHVSHEPCELITTRQYRAPEIGLKLSYNCNSDVWAEGCTLFELFSGKLLFPCVTEIEKCFQIERLFGKIPRKLGKHAKTIPFNCFDEKGDLKYDDSTCSYRKRKSVKGQTFEDIFGLIDTKKEDASALLSLLKEMLAMDFNRRIKSEDILRHSFWTCEYRQPQISGVLPAHQ